MASNLLSPEELEGQRLANELTGKLKKLADDRIDIAIKKLGSESSSADIQKLCNSIEAAIKSLKSDSPSAIANIENIQSAVDTARSSTQSTNALLKELIEISKAPRIVVYDDFGRIVRIERGRS